MGAPRKLSHSALLGPGTFSQPPGYIGPWVGFGPSMVLPAAAMIRAPRQCAAKIAS